jgi:hypothetical protein
MEIQLCNNSTHVPINKLLCLFVCFEPHEQFFSYLATVTIVGDRAANLDLCLALTAFSSEGSFTCHTYCDTGPPFLRSYPKTPWFYLLNAVLLAKEQSLPILNVLGLTRPVRAGFELMTYCLLREDTTTRLRQPVMTLSPVTNYHWPLCWMMFHTLCYTLRWPSTASFDDVVHQKIHSFMLDFFSEGANCVGTRNDTLSWSYKRFMNTTFTPIVKN